MDRGDDRILAELDAALRRLTQAVAPAEAHDASRGPKVFIPDADTLQTSIPSDNATETSSLAASRPCEPHEVAYTLGRCETLL